MWAVAWHAGSPASTQQNWHANLFTAATKVSGVRLLGPLRLFSQAGFAARACLHPDELYILLSFLGMEWSYSEQLGEVMWWPGGCTRIRTMGYTVKNEV
jgi:hypothetical protein